MLCNNGFKLSSAVLTLPRVLSPEMAKQQRLQPQPVYTDRVYDSTRAQPTQGGSMRLVDISDMSCTSGTSSMSVCLCTLHRCIAMFGWRQLIVSCIRPPCFDALGWHMSVAGSAIPVPQEF